MVRRFTSCLILVILASLGFSQAFGRFGYSQSATVPGFKVDREGFVANDPVADKVRFASPSREWRPLRTSAFGQTIGLTPRAGSPSRAEINLLGLGFSLYFEKGIDLRVDSIGAPYLSWTLGTVGADLPTPKAPWLVLSFKNKQPAIVFGFLAEPASLKITGSPGAWQIRSEPDFQGWVRVGLPEGLDAHLANTPAALGRLAKVVADHADVWISRPPEVAKLSMEADLYSVTATWQFDKPNALIPPAATLAYLGSYPLQIQSPTKKLPGWNEDGPIEIARGYTLKIRFPIKRVPTGRSLALGIPTSEPIGTVSPVDIPSVVDLAMETLVAGRDTLTRKSSEEALSDYVSQANYQAEPWTQQQLPFDSRGVGLDLAAAHAFLMQANTATSRSTSESNSLLTSVTWRQDWYTWRAWSPDLSISLRTGALAAMAGALCPEPERRLTAAMFQAGISGYRGLQVWRRRNGQIEELPKTIEPIYGVRKGLFGLYGPLEDGEAFANSLISPLRVFSEQSVTLVKQGQEFILQWGAVEAKPSVITLATAYPIEAAAKANLAKLKVESALGFTELHYVPETAGLCEVRITLPSFAKQPVEIAKVPSYSEGHR